ncbi:MULTISPECIES: YaaR family protein [Clostridium]|uniref:DUF327 domain-containing protein n=3 Tax=Clostridium intestinale TaxID=36845 RepID=U2Q2N0_9CLOT|nr:MULTISPECIES: YaaR family protein [Clostridium]ERK30334.1 hypothetical protein CINTURNW_2338 [Clostridium intestinale URNW]QLY81740.1 YaaR family protein [Clostridium intestinale]WRY52419.1 YaaR family protein [Clostridium intestinale]SHH42283.1 hypothetical protein SAMN02745941_00023 [Clostridium intestinale DSM 6191]
MEIKRVGKNTRIDTERKISSSRKDFSQSFNQARDRRSGEELKRMIDDIKKRGNRLVLTKTYADVAAYKRMIKDYLESILKYMYDLKKDVSFWQTQYFLTVDTIDGKLEELTNMLLSEERENLNIASTIDEIQGLIVDIYR